MSSTTSRRNFVAPVTFDRAAAGESRQVSGHAAVFNSMSENLGFFETLAPGCFRNTLLQHDDQQLLYNHDRDAILARRGAGTLQLTEDAEGLAFVATLADTQLGRDVATLIREGNIRGCSFSFSIRRSGEDREQVEGYEHRRVREIAELKEISIVTMPAYEATYVDVSRMSPRELVAEYRSRKGPKRSPAPRLSRGADPYEGTRHSWFRDKAEVQASDERIRNRPPSARFDGKDPGNPTPPGVDGFNLDDARQRLKQARAISTTSGGNDFVPEGMPPVLADAFTTAARAASVLPDVLGAEPMPKGQAGVNLKIPGFLSGVSAGVQAVEGEAVSQTDPTTGYTSSGPAMISGTTVTSSQLADLAADPGWDVEIAAELGAAIGTVRDQQIIAGTGTNKQTMGIINTPNAIATTYTDATPTTQKLVREGIGANWSAVAAALGRVPDTILMGTTRYAWLFSGYDTSKRVVQSDLLSAFTDPDQVPAMPVTSGANKNEDAVIVLNNDSVRLYLSQPFLRVTSDPLSGTAQVRYTAWQYVAVVVRKAAGVGIVLGTGLKSSPAFT